MEASNALRGPYCWSSPWPVGTFGRGRCTLQQRSDLVAVDSRENLKGEPPRLVQGCRFTETVVVANEHSGRCVIGLSQQVGVQVLLLFAPVRHEHLRLGRQVHPVLDPEAPLVLAHLLIRVSVAVLTPRLTGDQFDRR